MNSFQQIALLVSLLTLRTCLASTLCQEAADGGCTSHDTSMMLQTKVHSTLLLVSDDDTTSIDDDHVNITVTLRHDDDQQLSKMIQAAIEKVMQKTGRHWIISDGELACKPIGDERETCSLPLEVAPADSEHEQAEAMAQSENYEAEDKSIDTSFRVADKGQLTSPAALIGRAGWGKRKARKITDQEEKDAIEKLAEDMEDEDTRKKWDEINFYKLVVGYVARGIVVGLATVGESTCIRESRNKAAAFMRDMKAKCSWSWSRGFRCGCPWGWENPWWSLGFCYKPCSSHSKCDSDCNTIREWCHQGCNGWEDDGTKCWKPCADGFTQFNTECGETGYCSRDTGSCAAFIGNVIVDAGMVAVNLIPGTQAVKAAKVAAKTAAKAGKTAATKAAVKALLKEMGKDFLKDTLKNYFQSQLDSAMKTFLHGEPHEENGMKTLNIFEDNLMERAGEAVAKQVLAHTLEDSDDEHDLRWAVSNFNGVDPTGVMGIVNTLWKGSCADGRADDAPTENPATCGNPNPWICDYAFMLAKGFAAIPCPDPSNANSCTNAVCCVRDPSITTTTTPPPGTCKAGYYAEWSAGSSSYGCSRCYGSARRRRALFCTSCPSGKASRTNKDDCVNGDKHPLKKTCSRTSDCYDDYWKFPKVVCTTRGCKEAHRRRRYR